MIPELAFSTLVICAIVAAPRLLDLRGPRRFRLDRALGMAGRLGLPPAPPPAPPPAAKPQRQLCGDDLSGLRDEVIAEIEADVQRRSSIPSAPGPPVLAEAAAPPAH